jgi:hypothetical protein
VIGRDESDPRVIWLTGIDGWEHAIDDEEAVRGMRTGDGRYDSLCCRNVVAAPLVAPLGRRCPSCVRLVTAARSAPPQQEQWRGAAPRRPLRRLLRWRGR